MMIRSSSSTGTILHRLRLSSRVLFGRYSISSSLHSPRGSQNQQQGQTTTTVSSLPPVPKHCHRMVLMRHGESEFNNANIFTGWCDVALTQRGVVEAVEAGQVFLSHGLNFRKCYVSLLTRSIVTAHRSLEAAGVAYTPLHYDWRWNERHYGALQGLSKERTAIRLGREKVMKWRRSYNSKPPIMTNEHPHYDSINNDPRYMDLASVGVLPRGESLEDCQQRVIEAWNDLCKELRNQDNNDVLEEEESKYSFDYSLLVAHANTLRALVMYLDDIAIDDIESLNIPTAIPFYYDIDKRRGKVILDAAADDDGADNSGSGAIGNLGNFRGIYISDERKQRNFLERRRAANDPWLWALHDHQVATKLLHGGATTTTTTSSTVEDEELVLDEEEELKDDELEELEEEARKNTELFSPGQSSHSLHESHH